ncbi:thiamine pyrophosphate-dependent enzyme [Kutzneria viridogrisea]|uniref:2-oxoisovalerate dehydrogenase E1 component n=1 Tax=Kutzneria viridogrisea TaxID=47990 RepID=A0ABR6BPP3_9PSEU|nr:2-oxoisovalerate dehydrogenase E1 component [Kutzneria viridogrisea]
MTEQVDEHFLAAVAGLRACPAAPVADRARLLELFDAQLGSRHLDLVAREFRAKGLGYYTIGSAGHEGNVAVAAALRPTDPALLHYRSGAFYLERVRQAGLSTGLDDVLLGMMAATEEPIAGGRHKVFGNHAAAVIPQTSTIASHLPRAVGVAFAIERARKLGVDSPWPADALAVCSFGDASANHSTAAGAINTAVYCGYQKLPMPLLLVCEDNGLGISVPTPHGWIASAYGNRPGLRYFSASGFDLVQACQVAAEAADWVRRKRLPAFLHLHTVRLMGHAGSDLESAYRAPQETAAELARDPLLGTAEQLIACGALTPDEVVRRYEDKRAEVRARAERAAGRPQLDSAAAVLAPLAPRRPELVAQAVRPAQPHEPVTFAQAVNRTLADLLAQHPNLLVFGEDVGRKGGVYGVTRGLRRRFGAGRVFDTVLDEQSILGLALGTGVSGLLPIAEIQYLAYLHNAADQLRGEAATLRFFSNGQYRNPMVVRIAGYGYQKGFGGHFHNDNAIAALRDIPGLVIASPARPEDAAAMLRTCVAAAQVDGSVCAFLEPIALYHTRDLHTEGDGGWLAGPPTGHVPLGSGRTHGTGTDLTLVSFGNGVPMSLRVARRLAEHGLGARVLDLRWLAPLPVADLLREATATGRVLVVDETRRTGGVSESVLTCLLDNGFSGRVARVASEDSFVPLGGAALHVLLSEDTVLRAAFDLLNIRLPTGTGLE